MKFTPLGDRALIKQKQEEERTQGGLFIPNTAQERPLQGEVLAVGGGRVLENGEVVPVSVKPGDVVLFAQHSYIEIKLDGEDYLIIRDDNILGVVE